MIKYNYTFSDEELEERDEETTQGIAEIKKNQEPETTDGNSTQNES